MARHILILYGTSYGQTARISERIANQLTALGYAVSLVSGDEIPGVLAPGSFDAIIVGASVINGHHQRHVERFVREHRDVLNSVPSAFVSVSASAASRDASGQADARRLLAEFLRDTGWEPPLTRTIAGAIAYTRYNPFVRWMLRRICRKAGGPTDTSRDHELTDWLQVEDLVDEFTELMVGRGERAPLAV